MTSGVPISETQRASILRLFAEAGWEKAAIAKRLDVDRGVVQRVIDDAAKTFWRVHSAAAKMSDLADPH